MSFKPYPKYKESGVEWLGRVPEHWHVCPVKSISTVVNGYPFDSKLFDPSAGHPLIRIRDLNKFSTEAFYTGDFIDSAAVTSEDVLIGMDGDFNVGRWKGDGKALLNQRMCCLRGRSTLHTRLLEYALPIPLTAINAITYSTTVKHLSASEVEHTRVAIPADEAEMEQVTTFLDHETAKIDALIAEQQRLIELLQEKRQAVISHAVTKGLNPHAPMKDSGIEWLGEVPEHWEVAGLTKFLACVVDYRGRTPTKVDEGVFLLTARNVRDGLIDYEASQEYIAPDEYADVMRRGVPEHGDVLFTTEAPLGQVANVDRVDVALAQRIIKFRGRDGILDNYFLKYWLMGDFAQADMLRLATGSTALGIKGSKVGQLRLCIPPYDEQAEIVVHVDHAIEGSRGIIGESQAAITLLQERRSALISAAVTGQIDVRGFSGGGSEAA